MSGVQKEETGTPPTEAASSSEQAAVEQDAAAVATEQSADVGPEAAPTGFSPAVPSPNSKKRRVEGLPQIEYSRLEEYRKLLMPLSKEQMLDILARAACTHDDVYVTAKGIVDESPAARRLMVRNISFATENDSLRTVFSQFGPIEDFTICRERDGKSKGFGFVTFKHTEAVNMALNCPITLDARNLIVRLAADAQSDAGGDRAAAGFGGITAGGAGTATTASESKFRRKLFIRNLSDYTTTDRLRMAFTAFGAMEDCVVVHDPSTGKSKGYGFVTFVKLEDAQRAVQQTQRIIDGQMAFVAFASPGSGPKGDRSSPFGAGAGAQSGLAAQAGFGTIMPGQRVGTLTQPQAIDPATYAHLYNAQLQQQMQQHQLHQQQAQAAQQFQARVQ